MMTDDIYLKDFSEEAIDHLEYMITKAMYQDNPMEWMSGYIEGLLYKSEDGYWDVVLLDAFWSHMWQGGGEFTTPGHIGTSYLVGSLFNEVVSHLIETDRIHMDALLDFIKENTRERTNNKN